MQENVTLIIHNFLFIALAFLGWVGFLNLYFKIKHLSWSIERLEEERDKTRNIPWRIERLEKERNEK